MKDIFANAPLVDRLLSFDQQIDSHGANTLDFRFRNTGAIHQPSFTTTKMTLFFGAQAILI